VARTRPRAPDSLIRSLTWRESPLAFLVTPFYGSNYAEAAHARTSSQADDNWLLKAASSAASGPVTSHELSQVLAISAWALARAPTVAEASGDRRRPRH
jgi:hypothetical protein